MSMLGSPGLQSHIYVQRCGDVQTCICRCWRARGSADWPSGMAGWGSRCSTSASPTSSTKRAQRYAQQLQMLEHWGLFTAKLPVRRAGCCSAAARQHKMTPHQFNLMEN